MHACVLQRHVWHRPERPPVELRCNTYKGGALSTYLVAQLLQLRLLHVDLRRELPPDQVFRRAFLLRRACDRASQRNTGVLSGYKGYSGVLQGYSGDAKGVLAGY
jgi:hypothetical protein